MKCSVLAQQDADITKSSGINSLCLEVRRRSRGSKRAWFHLPRLVSLLLLVNFRGNRRRRLFQSAAPGTPQAPQQLNKSGDFYVSPRHTVVSCFLYTSRREKSKENSSDWTIKQSADVGGLLLWGTLSLVVSLSPSLCFLFSTNLVQCLIRSLSSRLGFSVRRSLRPHCSSGVTT